MDALSNSSTLRADTIELWDAAASRYVGIQELLIGIPPSDMNTMEKVAGALGNDPGYFETIAAGLDAKASLAYTNSELLKKSDLSTTTALLNDRYSKVKTNSFPPLSLRNNLFTVYLEPLSIC